MWKFLGKKFGRHQHASDHTPAGSVADLRGKFYLEKHCAHGFPLGPSCMTFDLHRKVLFIGTNTGELRMLGQPGVELTGIHDDIYKVQQILPFASEPSLITICSNNVMHKWGLIDVDGNSRLVLKRTYKFQGGLAKTITTCCLPPYCDCLFVGTLGGITYPMDTEFDGMSPEVLSWSRARAYLKYKGRDIPGCVKTLEISPANPKQLLIGYENNYLELWDALTWKPITIFGPLKDESVGGILATCWHSNGTQFITSHQSGEVSFWNLNEKERPFMIKRLHENARVQPMTSVLWPSDNLQVMSGGAPTDMVDGDSVTIVNNGEVETLQLTSPVKGMHVLEDQQADRDSGIVNYAGGNGDSTTSRKILVLLLEQEILFIELTFPDFPILKPPYLFSMHNSPVKAIEVYSGSSKEVVQTISQVGRVQLETIYTAQCKGWPIDGGIMDPPKHDNRELLISGHEDGTVKFWDIRNSNMHLLYVLNCSNFFISSESDFFRSESPDSDVEEKRPKQIGFWDPRSDDDQIQVTCLKFYEDKLLVGIEAGMSLLFTINNQSGSAPIQHHRVSIMRDDPRQRGRNFQAPMDLRTDNVECPPGYQPRYCVGIFPKVSVSAVALAKDHGLIGVGCMYGFTIVDYTKNQTIHVHSTYNEASPEQGGALSRMQSIRKSFRQSLKRFDVRRSMRGMQSMQRSYRPNLQRSGSTRPSMKNRTHGGGLGGSGASNDASVEATPLPPRRDIIKTIDFTAPCLITGHSKVHAILVGTNQGSVLGYTVDMPAAKHRDTRSPIVMPVEREFNAKRNLPVLFSGVIDQQNYLLDINDEGSYHSSSKGSQYMVVVTEEGLKVTSLPNMKKKYRVKLKQSDSDLFHLVSARYVRVAGYSAILTMGSDGFLTVYSLPDLKQIYKEDCVDASDAIGQRNFTVARNGTLLHQRSPSEFTRGSITEDSRLEFHFSLPSKHVSPLMLTPNTPKSMNGEPIFEVTHHQIGPESPQKSVTQGFPPPPDALPLSDQSGEMDNGDIVKSKEPAASHQTQFPFEAAASPQSLKEFQERAL